LASLAYIGADESVADFGANLPYLTHNVAFTGFGAWWLWRSVYLSKQVSWKSKFMVAVDWIKNGIFGRDLTRN